MITACPKLMGSLMVAALSLASLQILDAEGLASIPEATGSIPEMLKSPFARHGDRPWWVSASVAFDAAGRVQAEVLATGALTPFEPLMTPPDRRAATQPGEIVEPRQMGPGECRGTTNLVGGGLRTIAETLEAPYVWLRGTVEAGSPGFLSGLPGTLLKVKAIRELGAVSNPRPHSVLVFVPRAQFAVGNWEFCTGDFPPPKESAAVLVVARVEPGISILILDDRTFFEEDGTGTLQVARGWHAEPALRGVKSLSQLELVVEKALLERRTAQAKLRPPAPVLPPAAER